MLPRNEESALCVVAPTAGPQAWLRAVCWAALLAAASEALYFAVAGHGGFNHADEGFLWEGVLRTLQGKVPIRDFYSYDPGRYYWCALLSPVTGSGLVGVRAALAVLHGLALFAALVAVTALAGRRPAALAAALLLIWNVVPHKQPDVAASLVAVAAGALLVRRPGPCSCFVAGVVVGGVSVIGRNHGLYALAGLGALVVYTLAQARLVRPGQAAALGLLGLLIGYLPVLVMFAVVPNFLHAFSRELLLQLHRPGTNLPLPIPWPGRAVAETAGWPAVCRLALGIAFVVILVLLPTVGVLAAWRGSRRGGGVLLLAAAAMGVGYAHHASVRAGLSHLAQGIGPALLAAAVLTMAVRPAAVRAGLTVLLLMGSAAAVWPAWRVQPGILHFCGKPTVRVPVGPDRIRLTPDAAKLLDRVREIVEAQVPPGHGVLFAPYTPGFYPLVGRTCPVYNSYLLWPGDEAEQTQMIADLGRGRITLAILQEGAVDNRPDLGFRRTHPEVWDYLHRDFEPVAGTHLPGYEVLRLRAKGPL